MVGQDDERGQVVREAPQAVAHPGPHRGEARAVEPGGLEERPLAVDARLADDVMDERDLVDDRAERRDGSLSILPALAVRLEIEDRPQPRPEPVLERLDGLAEVGRLAVPLDQFGLVVEQVDVAGGPGHEQVNDPLRLRGVVEPAVGRRPGRAPSRASMAVKAIPPRPPPECQRNSRRFMARAPAEARIQRVHR